MKTHLHSHLTNDSESKQAYFHNHIAWCLFAESAGYVQACGIICCIISPNEYSFCCYLLLQIMFLRKILVSTSLCEVLSRWFAKMCVCVCACVCLAMFQDFRIIVMDIKHHLTPRIAIFLHLCSFHFLRFVWTCLIVSARPRTAQPLP